MKQLLLATNNPGKVKELKQGLKHLGLSAITPSKAGLPENFDVEETGKTFEENAILKAKGYAKASGLMSLADDSGLIVEALDGRPGVYSSRYGPSSQARNQKLLRELKDKTNRKAYFESVIAIYDPKTNQLKTTSEKTHGTILQKPEGEGGFGYDPVFFSKDLNKSFGKTTPKEKNRVSHRGRALQKTINILKKWQ